MEFNISTELRNLPEGAQVVRNASPYDGVQFVVRFPNNWGASIIHNKYSYGVELATVHWDHTDADMDDFDLRDSAIGTSVFGYLDPTELLELLGRIRLLTPNGNELTEGK